MATPDKIIADLIKKIIMMLFCFKITKQELIEFLKRYKNFFSEKPNIIINLQGDMPNLEPKIIKLNKHLEKKNVIWQP